MDVEIMYSNKAITLEEMGEYEEAIKYYDMAIESNPDFPNAHNNREKLLNQHPELAKTSKIKRSKVKKKNKHAASRQLKYTLTKSEDMPTEREDMPTEREDMPTEAQLYQEMMRYYQKRGKEYAKGRKR